MMLLSGGGGGESAFCDSSTADCCEDFDIPDTSDLLTDTNFDADSGGIRLDIYGYELRYDAQTTAADYVKETTCLSSPTEITIKFTVEFEDVVDIDNVDDRLRVLNIWDSDTEVAYFQFQTDAGGDLLYYRCYGVTTATTSNTITMTGVAADTKYTVYVYYLEGASGEVSCIVNPGTWAEATTGAINNAADDGITKAYLGVLVAEWGDGGTDTFVYFDNFEIFLGDEMP